MNIFIPSTQVKSFQAKIAEYDSQNFRKEFRGKNILYKFLYGDLEPYSVVRAMMEEGIEFTGFPAYIKMTKAAYDTNLVPVGISYSEILDVNGEGTGVQKAWNVWQTGPNMVSNDNLEVIIPTTYQNQAATPADLDIFDTSVDVMEMMGLQLLKADYQNNILWLKDELGDPLPESPIDKTAGYYTLNWESEAFDMLHAQRLVNQWFQALVGATDTDKFNTLDAAGKREVIRWGILDDSAEGKGLIEATVLNKSKRTSYRLWHIRRLIKAREARFNFAWTYLIDNLKVNAINTRLGEMLTYELKEFYINRGSSNQTNHLIVNGEVNPTFWATFIASDVSYTDVTLADMKSKVEQILDGNKYAS